MNISQSDIQYIKKSKIFDREWYSSQYPDVVASGLTPEQHFFEIGIHLLRDPNSQFSSHNYLEANEDVKSKGYCPLTHYLKYGKKEGRPTEPSHAHDNMGGSTSTKTQRLWGAAKDLALHDYRRISGVQSRQRDSLTVMLVAHVVSNELFGSERSFIDMLRGLNSLDLNIVVVLPSGRNPDYVEYLKTLSNAVIITPYDWWRKGHQIDERAVASFSRVISEENVDVAHVNTIVLREPLIAARRMGVPSITHTRELIEHDNDLCEMIGLPADEIIREVWDGCDILVANSVTTANGFEKFCPDDRKAHVVYNTADIEQISDLPLLNDRGKFVVSLISSNIPKKGIWDFVEIAKIVSKERSDIVFKLIGPENIHTKEIEGKINDRELPDSIEISGYAESPKDALSVSDLVLSISNFYESFGRTVLEAMAAARPVVVYDHGGPVELVDHGKTGFVVAPYDIDDVSRKILELAQNREMARKMGFFARIRANREFGQTAYSKALSIVYRPFIEKCKKGTVCEPKPITLRARNLPKKIKREDLKIAYFCWHFPVPSETFILNELRILKEQGLDVRVFCRQIPYPDFALDIDIEFDRVASPEELSAKLIETGRNVVHGHFVHPVVSKMVWPACKMAKIPFTCMAHAQDIFRYENDVENQIEEFSVDPLCKKVFTLSKFHRQYLIDRGVPPEKIEINSNCVDPDLFSDGKVEDRYKREQRSICAISRFAEKKGLENLIRASSFLKEESIQINIFGYGPLEKEFRNLISEQNLSNVTLHGQLSGRDSILEVFRNHDLLVVPSVRAEDGDMDGIPTTLLEAMSSGLPVLTTPVAGIPDLVKDGSTGLLTDDPSPKALAKKIAEFYEMPEVAIKAMIAEGERQVRRHHDGPVLVDTLIRNWAGETVDLMIVSWNNLPQTREVIRRLYEYTQLPFHLIVCDNGSDRAALEHLLGVYATNENFTLILNRENAFVGPGTNKCIKQGDSDYMIYVCGKEGFTTDYGWEKKFVTYMNDNVDVGQAGTLCYSPSYLFGRDYPKQLELFPKFRNTGFATENPDRKFAHVQGGFFVIRRSVYDQIGGFSPDVFHSYTDVEYSYYVESCGWKLGEVPGLMALFNKTKPGIGARVDEHHTAVHPPSIHDLQWLDRLARKKVRRCNVCETQGSSFAGGDVEAICKNCGSTRRARTIHRVLSESMFLYRRLPAWGVNIPDSLREFWQTQFQGPVSSIDEVSGLMQTEKRLPNRSERMELVLVNNAFDAPSISVPLAAEVFRLLAPGAALCVFGSTSCEELDEILVPIGFAKEGSKRFSSKAIQFDWYDTLIYTKLSG